MPVGISTLVLRVASTELRQPLEELVVQVKLLETFRSMLTEIRRGQESS
jgi:hypothetical protein